jgi:citrate lyase alpha subunit
MTPAAKGSSTGRSTSTPTRSRRSSSAATRSAAADKFETALTSAGTIVARFTLASVTKTNGIADAADGVWTAVASGAAIPAIVILSNKGSAATNRLIAYIDTATGLPVTPNGGNINVAWDNGSNKIFKL